MSYLLPSLPPYRTVGLQCRCTSPVALPVSGRRGGVHLGVAPLHLVACHDGRDKGLEGSVFLDGFDVVHVGSCHDSRGMCFCDGVQGFASPVNPERLGGEEFCVVSISGGAECRSTLRTEAVVCERTLECLFCVYAVWRKSSTPTSMPAFRKVRRYARIQRSIVLRRVPSRSKRTARNLIRRQ